MKAFIRRILTILILFICSPIIAQTTLSLAECEALFLKKNLLLVAEQFNIDASKAQIIQAKLWQNPYLSGEINAYNPSNKKTFDIGSEGQKALAIQQLIYLGGKKRAEVQLAKTNSVLAELLFKDLLRNLKFQLRTSFYSIYYDKISLSAIEKQIVTLDTLIQSYSVQVSRGNIPLKEVVRLQSLYVTLKNDRKEFLTNIYEEENRLQTILSSDSEIVPSPKPEELTVYTEQLKETLDSLEIMALTNRADILYSNKNIESAEWFLKWQKALAMPDLTLGAAYDQRGGAFVNQTNLTLGIPLVLWNRNQGNIKIAKSQLGRAQSQKDFIIIEMKNEVRSAFKKYALAKSNLEFLTPTNIQNFNEVYSGMYRNFQIRNVSLIEFTDFMESYNQSLIEFNDFRKSLTKVCEELNYVTGTKIF